ncbi:MAG: hypothetical protein ABIP55_02815 [Tepidisphaeraceae bacterium]
MAAVRFPVKRPVGRALIVGSASSRAQPLAAMQALGYTCAELDDPYAATAELCKRPLVYRAIVMSLTSLFREELPAIGTIKQRLPHVEVWLAHLEGRQAALAEAMRLGADGLLGDDGNLHRTALTPAPPVEMAAEMPVAAALEADADTSTQEPNADLLDFPTGEPVLSADELRALLQEQPTYPPEGDN